jgi:hypothetical protein
MKYFYKKFKYNKNKKYLIKNKSVKSILYKKFENELIEFSNSYWVGKKQGGLIIKNAKYDYVLFFNKTEKLIPYKKY